MHGLAWFNVQKINADTRVRSWGQTGSACEHFTLHAIRTIHMIPVWRHVLLRTAHCSMLHSGEPKRHQQLYMGDAQRHAVIMTINAQSPRGWPTQTG